MNEKIYRGVRKTFFSLGRFIEIRKFPVPEEVYGALNYKDPKIHLHELKRICIALKDVNALNYYNRLLVDYIPQLNINPVSTQFVGEGHSTDSLNVYRKIQFSEKTWFEKVYTSYSIALNKMVWLEKNIYPYFENELTIPRVMKVISGEFLTVVYFDYIAIRKNKRANTEKQAVAIANYFYTQSLNAEFIKGFNSAPSYLTDFKYHGKYNAWAALAERNLEHNQLDRRTIENILESGRLVFTHGDIKPNHLLSGKGLIDWDEAGLYPAGFEQAYLYFSYKLTHNRMLKSPLEWLKNNFKPVVSQAEWKMFSLSFIYFLFVFSQKEFKKGNYLPLKRLLIKELKSKMKSF